MESGTFKEFFDHDENVGSVEKVVGHVSSCGVPVVLEMCEEYNEFC